MKLIITSLAIIFLAACSGKSGKKETPVTDTIKQSTTTPVTNNTETLVIDKNAAVFYNPDSAQMEKWKKEAGGKNFETVIDDWSSYMNSSSEYLTTTGLPVIDASGKKLLKFVKADHSVTEVRLDTLSNYWGMYLFSTAKEPQYADIIMMEESYKKYFK
jgi:hypothetical protein